MRAVKSEEYLAALAREEESAQPIFWSMEGRTGRLRYLGRSFVTGILSVLLVVWIRAVDWDQAMAVLLLFGLPLMWIRVCLASQRLNDIGRPRWIAFSVMMPIVSVVTWLYLVLRRGRMHQSEQPVVQTLPVAPDAPLVSSTEETERSAVEQKLLALRSLRDKGLISEAAYEAKQLEVLGRI